MYFLYLDESGDDGESGSKFYVLAGIAIKDSLLASLQTSVRSLVDSTFNPWEEAHVPQMYFKESFKDRKLPREVEEVVMLRPELHYTDLISDKRPYNTLSSAQKKGLADAVFSIINKADVKLFAVAIDKGRHFAKYALPKPVDLFSVEMIAERFQWYLDAQFDVGVLVYDQKDRHNNDIFRNFVDTLRSKGTAMRPIPRIVENMMFLPSNLSEALQLADFCAHAVFMKYERNKDRRFTEVRKKFFSVKVFP